MFLGYIIRLFFFNRFVMVLVFVFLFFVRCIVWIGDSILESWLMLYVIVVIFFWMVMDKKIGLRRVWWEYMKSIFCFLFWRGYVGGIFFIWMVMLSIVLRGSVYYIGNVMLMSIWIMVRIKLIGYYSMMISDISGVGWYISLLLWKIRGFKKFFFDMVGIFLLLCIM